jgi:hypothetical protein
VVVRTIGEKSSRTGTLTLGRRHHSQDSGLGDPVQPLSQRNPGGSQERSTVAYYHMGDKTMYENDWSYFAYRLKAFYIGL